MAKKKMAELAEVGIEPNAWHEMERKIEFVKIKAFDRPQDKLGYDPLNPDHFPDFPGLKKLNIDEPVVEGHWLIRMDVPRPDRHFHRLTYSIGLSMNRLKAANIGDYGRYWAYKEIRKRPYPKPLPLP